MNYDSFQYCCDFCNIKIIGRKAYDIINHKKNGQTKRAYCSSECRQKALNSFLIKLDCHQCGDKLNRRPKSIKSEFIFCNATCRTLWFNEKRTKYKICRTCGNAFKKHKRKNPIYCNIKCQKQFENEIFIDGWKSGKIDGNTGTLELSSRIRRYIFEKYNFKCALCGIQPINPFSNRSTLQVEHIDGDSSNQKENNLTLLCPTCHSLTSTYMALNKGHGRSYRQKLRLSENKQQ